MCKEGGIKNGRHIDWRTDHRSRRIDLNRIDFIRKRYWEGVGSHLKRRAWVLKVSWQIND